MSKQPYFSIYRNPITVVLCLIIAGGVMVYGNMHKSLFPEITFPKIKVIADNGLQPVNKMMITVTKPLENAVKKVPHLLTVRSITSRGSCEISAYMDWSANIDLSQQQIEAQINEIQTDLPPGVKITVEKMNPSILPVMGYAIESNKETAIELKQLALYTIKPFLSQVEGVAEVAVSGGKTKEYWIVLNPQKMSALSITPDQMSQAVGRTNFILSTGYQPDYRRLYLTVTDATVNNLQQLDSIVISSDAKRTIRLKDIAQTKVHPANEYVRINANGKSAVLVSVIKQPNANLIDVSNQMKQKIKELQETLPKDVSITPYYIQADFVDGAVRSVSDALLLGVLLALVVAVIFLRSAKASATILITVPVTLALTLIVLYSIGYTLNIMTLGAIAAAIGLIIDDAIVVVEQIHRMHDDHPAESSPNLVQQSIHYLLPAMVSSSISTIVIFLPFAFMSGVAGAYFTVLSNTMIIALTCSFFVTWMGLPVVYLLFSKGQKKVKSLQPIPVKPQQWVLFFGRYPLFSVALILSLAITVYILIPRLESGFLPTMDEGAIILDYSSPPGTSLEETDRILQEVEKMIVKIPEVESYSRRTGTQLGFFITEPNRGDYLIELKKNRIRTTDEVIDDIRQKVENSQPALRIDFGQVITDMLGDLMTSVQPIEIKIFGNDQQQLNRLAEQTTEAVNSVKGTADVFDGIVAAGPSVNITPHPDVLAQYGLSPADLQSQLQTQTEGNVVGTILESEQQTDIRMIYPNVQQSGINGLKEANIFLPNGKLKPIQDLADIQIGQGANELQRENLQSMAVVTARLNNRDLGRVMNDIQKEVSKRVHLPQGYHITYGGEYAQQQQSFRELLLILISASLLVFGVILLLSKDFFASLTLLLIAVVGISGSVIALFITGTPLNVGSYTGIVMIVGIIGENAIFTLLQFKKSLKELPMDDALVNAVSIRLRPNLMTAFGAIIALMPLAFGIGTGAQLHQPLAIAVIGGFVVALPLLLIVLPSLLKILYRADKGRA